MKNAFYFTLKTLFILSPGCFGHVEKQLDKKDKVILKNYDVTIWLTKRYDTHIVQYLKK